METISYGKIIRNIIMMVLWTIAIYMIFCDGGSFAGQLLMKAGGFGLGWLLFRLMGFRS